MNGLCKNKNFRKFKLSSLNVINAEVSSVNLAVRSRFTICPSKRGTLSKELIDGNLYNLVHSITENCLNEEIVCDLSDFYYIHYVVVFGGESMTRGEFGKFYV